MPPAERRIGWLGPRDRYWGWILDRIPQAMLLGSLGEWHADSESDVLLVALDNRASADWLAISEIHRSKSEAAASTSTRSKSKRKGASQPLVLDSSISLLLGESWVGHRRTLPIPESFGMFYWYELWDRLLPSLDLGIGRSDFESPERGQRVARWQSIGEQWDRLDSRMHRVLAVADSSTTHTLWQETLEQRLGSVLGVYPEQLDRFRYQADMVLIDLDPPPPKKNISSSDAHHQRVVATLRKVRRRFPGAMTVVADGFPRWTDWQVWSDSGADLLFPKPGCLFGLNWGLNRWAEMSLTK